MLSQPSQTLNPVGLLKTIAARLCLSSVCCSDIHGSEASSELICKDHNVRIGRGVIEACHQVIDAFIEGVPPFWGSFKEIARHLRDLHEVFPCHHGSAGRPGSLQGLCHILGKCQLVRGEGSHLFFMYSMISSSRISFFSSGVYVQPFLCSLISHRSIAHRVFLKAFFWIQEIYLFETFNIFAKEFDDLWVPSYPNLEIKTSISFFERTVFIFNGWGFVSIFDFLINLFAIFFLSNKTLLIKISTSFFRNLVA